MTNHNFFILIVCWAWFDLRSFVSDNILNIYANQIFQKSKLMKIARQCILTVRWRPARDKEAQSSCDLYGAWPETVSHIIIVWWFCGVLSALTWTSIFQLFELPTLIEEFAFSFATFTLHYFRPLSKQRDDVVANNPRGIPPLFLTA
jgi:hypothetical protein